MEKTDLEQKSDEWKKFMILNIGGSEVFNVLGNGAVFDDQECLDVERIAERKRDRYITNQNIFLVAPMLFGKVLEPIAAKFLAKKFRIELKNVNDCFVIDGVTVIPQME